MKPETERGMDHLVQRIGELAAEVRTLADIAEKQYAIEVQDLLKAQVRDPVCITRCLDGMLDFCFHDGVLILYKKLCRYYYDVTVHSFMQQAFIPALEFRRKPFMISQIVCR